MIFMVLTQTQIDGLQTQYTAMSTAAKANFLTAIAAAASPNDVVVAVKAVEDELDALDYLNDVINREQELVDASGNSDDDSDSTTATTDPTVAVDLNAAPADANSTPPETQATTAPAETSTPVAETAAPAAATIQAPAAQDIINQATAVVQNNPALLQDIVNVANTVKENPDLLTKLASVLSNAPNGDQNIITQGIVEVKNLLTASPK